MRLFLPVSKITQVKYAYNYACFHFPVSGVHKTFYLYYTPYTKLLLHMLWSMAQVNLEPVRNQHYTMH